MNPKIKCQKNFLYLYTNLRVVGFFILGMLLAGFLLRNIPVISDNIQIKHKWSSALRSIALSIILVRAGLGLDSKV